MFNRKCRSQRISVNLPEEMMSNLKYRSLATGLSISRLIYLQLRSRKPQMLVTNEVLKEANLKARVEQMAAVVRLDEPTEVFHIVKTVRNRGEN